MKRLSNYIDTASFINDNIVEFKNAIRIYMKENWGTNWKNDPEALNDFERNYGFLPDQAAKIMNLFDAWYNEDRLDPRFSKDEEL